MGRFQCIAYLLIAAAVPGIAYSATEPSDSEESAWKVDERHGPSHLQKLTLREGTWMSVSVYGDWLTFDLLGDIWLLPLAGGEAQRLTEGASWDGQPQFSPDGQQIAFTSDRGGNEELWVMERDGSGVKPITKEGDARITHPIWDPSGDWVLGRRRTVDTRSIGVTEIWKYHMDGGSGYALTAKKDHPHAGEMALSADGKQLYYSSRRGRFNYGQDPLGGLWSVMQMDLHTGETQSLLSGAGSASRPVLSPDGGSLAFVSRSPGKTLLEVLDLESGRRQTLIEQLDRDELEGFALHGTYPSISWTEKGLVYWAGGKLWRIPDLEQPPQEIAFQATGEWSFRQVQRWAPDIEAPIVSQVIRWPSMSVDGTVAFSSMGHLYTQGKNEEAKRLSEGLGYAPSWSPDGRSLAWTSWDDQTGGRLHIQSGRRVKELPIQGLLLNPAWHADGERLAVLRYVHTGLDPDLNANESLEIVLLEKEGRKYVEKRLGVIESMDWRSTRLFFQGERLYFAEAVAADDARMPRNTILSSMNLSGYDRRQHVNLGSALEVAISPDFKRLAYRKDHQLWLAAMPQTHSVVPASSLPSVKLTEVVGDWVSFTADSQEVTWAQGNQFYTQVLPPLGEKNAGEPQSLTLLVERERAQQTESLVLNNCRIITMQGDEVLEGQNISIKDGKIVEITNEDLVGDREIDCAGGTVLPGLIDVHAHLHYTAHEVLPEEEWRYLTNLDFGVTTVHDPSADTDTVFTQAERVAVGDMQGPRVFSTGYILYGALGNGGAETDSLESAHAHVKRLKTAGATSVKVYQQSQRERRQWYVAACNAQQVLCVAEGGGDLFMNLSMVADGFHAVEHSLPSAPLYDDVRQFFAASIAEGSEGTAYTPTLLVAYGGLGAEHLFYQEENPWNHERLRRHYPTRMLEARSVRRPLYSADELWNHEEVAKEAAKMARDGIIVSLGAHGQLQGLGAHWELRAMASEGAMSNHEALRAATFEGARYLGLDEQIGSVTVGKYADLILVAGDPLEDLKNTEAVQLVLKGGQIMMEDF